MAQPRRQMSFAERVVYFPLHVEENPNTIERQYLLGGGNAKSKVKYNPVMDHQPLVPVWTANCVKFGSWLSLFMSIALLVICLVEYKAAANQKDEKCPLLIVGCIIAGLALINAVIGIAAAGRKEDGTRETLYYVHHIFSILTIVLLIIMAIGTLVHWDASGVPVHDMFHRPEQSALKYRFLIWGLALTTALVLIVSLFGTLGREWVDEDAVFKATFRLAAFLQIVIGAAIITFCVMIWHHKEVKAGASPVHMIGAIVSACALIALHIGYLGANSFRTLTHYLIWLPLVAVPVLAFSIGLAITAENQGSRDRRHNAFAAGLVGVWGQLITIISLIAASRWRYYLYSTDALPEYAKV